jgi:hypothetical protein
MGGGEIIVAWCRLSAVWCFIMIALIHGRTGITSDRHDRGVSARETGGTSRTRRPCDVTHFSGGTRRT